MDVTVKRERIIDPMHTFLEVPKPVTSFLPVPVGLDLEGCILAPENSVEDEELRRLNRAIALRDRHTLGSSEDGSPGRLSQTGKGRRYRNETEEGRKIRLARDAERRRQSRKLETEQDAVSRRAKQAAARRYYLQYLETEEDAKRRRKQNAEHKRIRRQQVRQDRSGVVASSHLSSLLTIVVSLSCPFRCPPRSGKS